MFSKTGDTVVINTSNVSANSAITAPGTGQSYMLRVVNQSTATAYVKLSATAGPVATTVDYPIEAGGVAHIAVNDTIGYIGVILGAATTGTLSVATGVSSNA